MLRVEGLETAYGDSQVLFGIDLFVGEGEAVSLIGRNGMGKTTIVRSIMGLTQPASGGVRFDEETLNGGPLHAAARAGIGLVPEDRQIFPNLTVREQLVATAMARGSPPLWTEEEAYRLFPPLAARADAWGRQLSGGEQQMLAIARALLLNPKLLILDEATEGLAPVVRDKIWRALSLLKDRGLSVLVIDKHVEALLGICQRHYIVEKGRIVWEGDSASLRAAEDVRMRYLGV